MRKNYLIFAFITIIVFFGFGHTSENQAKESRSNKSKLLIYYFHSTHRCPTCLSIEEKTTAVLNKYFAKELKDGLIEFQSINVDDKANEKVVKKYDAFGSALFFTTLNQGKEQSEDLTNFAFKYSRRTDYFMNELKKKIEEKVK